MLCQSLVDTNEVYATMDIPGGPIACIPVAAVFILAVPKCVVQSFREPIVFENFINGRRFNDGKGLAGKLLAETPPRGSAREWAEAHHLSQSGPFSPRRGESANSAFFPAPNPHLQPKFNYFPAAIWASGVMDISFSRLHNGPNGLQKSGQGKNCVKTIFF